MTNEFNLPEGWEVKDFKTCLEKVKYTNKIKRKNFLKSGKFPIVSQEQEYINGYWNDSKDVFKIIKPVIIFGDHTQVLKYVDFDFVLGADGVKILQPINSIDCKFFYYFLMGINVKSLGYARHYRLLKDKSVPVPSTFEQKRIVAILDEAFASIAKAKESAENNLKNANEIFESYLQSVFENKDEGWGEKKLGNFATFRNGLNFTKGSDGEVIEIVGVKDFKNRFWVPFEHLESVTIDGKLREIDFLKDNDILTVRSNGNPELIGRTLLAGNVMGKVSHSGFTIRIRLNSKIIFPLYLCHYLKTRS